MRMAVVSGRGNGKSERARKSLQAVIDEAKNPEPFKLTKEMLMDAITEARLAPYSWAVEDARYRAKVLGQWEYTPQDELRDRLNDRLQEKDPAPVTNTRYWRGL